MDDMPETRIERVARMQGILVAAATGGCPDGHVHKILRRELIHAKRPTNCICEGILGGRTRVRT
jgi:hypothetical protein